MKLLAIAAIILGVALRIVLLSHECGSYDIAQKFFWGALVSEKGFLAAYATVNPYPSHAPLGFALQGLLVVLAGGSEERFGTVFRLFTSTVDLVSLVVLSRFLWRRDQTLAMWFVVAWALMPYIVIQASFHGNLDPLVGLLVLLSALVDRSRPMLSGAIMGCAASIKIPALFPLVALAVYHLARNRREGVAFCGGAAIPVLAFLCSPIFFIPDYLSILFLRYRGVPDSYGLWALIPSLEEIRGLSTALPLALMAAATGVASWRAFHGRTVRSAEVITCALMPVLFASQGFGIQYFYWIVPLLPLVSRGVWPYAAGLLVSLSFLNLSMIWPLLFTERCIGPLGYRQIDWLGPVSGGNILNLAELAAAEAVWILCIALWSKLMWRMSTRTA